MKTDIHPDYVECKVHCSCGNEFTTRSTVPSLRVELCSECHPFYTGKQKLVDTGGRVERFQRRLEKSKVPVVRGVMALAESMGLGFKALSWSANRQIPEEDQISPKAMGWTIAFA